MAERTPRLVAMTGYGREADRAAARDAGFEVHLVKPVDIQVLMNAVDSDRAAASRAVGSAV